ncbi:TPA: hypothetical protein QDB51_002713 [Burkholderia vietnamiensis]|nr:hypothetical protein [Burkholderia vietnamiensis]
MNYILIWNIPIPIVPMKPKTLALLVGAFLSMIFSVMCIMATFGLYHEARVGRFAASAFAHGADITPTWAYLTTAPFAVLFVLAAVLCLKKIWNIGKTNYNNEKAQYS